VASLPVGEFGGTVILRPRFLDGTSAPPISYIVKGEKLSEIDAVPPIVNFGRCLVGDRSAKRVLIRSRIGREVDRIVVSSIDGLRVSPAPEPHGEGGRMLVIEQEFQRAQAFQTKLCIEVQMKGGDASRVELPVVAYVVVK
jgi:hypothetical protein